jgi:predicted TIM-barrel fold metal-dependent hydrolase
MQFLPEMFLEYMDEAGVECTVLLQGPFYGNLNDLVAEAQRRWPKRFIGAAYLDPWADNSREEFQRIIEHYGLRIIKLELSEATGLAGLHPGVRLEDSAVRWFWEDADRRRMVVTLDLGPPGGRTYQTEQVAALLEKYRQLRIVIAHLGQPPLNAPGDERLQQQWRDQLSLGNHARVWFDTASLPYYARHEGFPFPSARACIQFAVETIGAQKLLWGTDAPAVLGIATYAQLLDYVAKHCDFLTANQRAQVLGENAAAVYR